MIGYKRSLSNTEYSVATKNKYLIAARIFLKEAYRTGYLQRDLTVNIRGFRQSLTHKKDGLTDHEIQLIQQYCQSLDKHYTNLRLKAITALLIYQGLRQIEICRLDVSHLQLGSRKILIQGKGQHDKDVVWLHPYVSFL